ncbi:MAG: NUDIX domain-containing protein [Ruminococcaceae bacterium]|nr:NUDIX domain-containing protein [Oscillospiraceae bacterium]
MTKREKSCGGVIFTRDGDELRYIVIRQTNDICCFPKGHMEAGESEEETAVREIKEETGLDVTLKDGFRECDAYRFTIDGEDVILKDVVYFLGEFNAQTPVPQEGELTEIYLLPYDEARAKLQFEASRKILDRADKFLKTK